MTPTPTPTETIEHALTRHNLTWHQLERLAEKALRDAQTRRHITLDPDRHHRAHDYFVDKGIRRLLNYNPDLAGGASITTSIYRHMLGETVPGSTLIDFLRRTHGDERRGTPIHETTLDTLPDHGQLDHETFEQLVENVSRSLTTRALNTLHTIGYDLLVAGLARWEIAHNRGIPINDIDQLLEEVGWQLTSTLKEAA